MWRCHKILQGCYLLLEWNTHSQIYLFTYLLMSIGKHSDMDWLQTQDCLLLWTADVDLWSNSVDWCGSKFYNPHTSDDNGMGTVLPTKLSRAASASTAIISFNREDVERAKYKNKQGSVWCNHCSSCCNVICVCWLAQCCPVAYWSPTGRLFRTFRAASIKWLSLR